MSKPVQTSRKAKSDCTLHASLDISISLAFNIWIFWAARDCSSSGIPVQLQNRQDVALSGEGTMGVGTLHSIRPFGLPDMIGDGAPCREWISGAQCA